MTRRAEEFLQQLHRATGVDSDETLEDYRARMLEQLERYRQRRFGAPDASDADVEKAYAAHREALEARLEPARVSMSGPSSQRETQMILSTAMDGIREVVAHGQEKRHFPDSLPPIPVIGALPTHDVNACSIRVPGTDEAVVIFTLGLTQFLNRLTKIMLTIYTGIDEKLVALRDRADSRSEMYELVDQTVRRADEELHIRFVETLYAFLGGDISELPPHFSDDRMDLFRPLLLHGAEMFIAGHEYGHVMLGHLGANCALKSHSLESVDVEVLQRSYEQEYDADHLGRTLSLTYNAISTGDMPAGHWYLAISAAGPSFFLKAASIYEEAHALLFGASSGLSTHPPGDLRSRRVESIFMEVTDLPPNPYVAEFGMIMDVLWSHLSGRLAARARW